MNALQIFQVLRQLALIAISIFLAKSQLSQEAIGQYELMTYVGTFLTFFMVNGLLQAMSPIYFKLDDSGRKVFIFNVFVVFGGLAVAFFVLLGFGKNWLLPLIAGQADLPHFDLFLLFLTLNLVSFPVEYFYLLKNLSRSIVGWGIASFGLQVAAVAVPLSMGFGLRESLLALAAVAFAKFLWTLILVARWASPRLDFQILEKYWTVAAPLMVSFFTGSLVVMFDSWLVGWHFSDEAQFAIYRFGARELPLAQALATALGVSLVPSLVQNFPTGLASLKASSRRLFHLLFPISILLIFFAKPLFPIVYNENFAASAPLFCICLLLTASRVLLPNSILVSMQQTGWLMKISLAELFLKVVLGFVFIQIWGLAGVVWSAVAVFFFEKIALILVLERRFGVRTGDWLDLRWFFGWLTLLLATFFWASFN